MPKYKNHMHGGKACSRERHALNQQLPNSGLYVIKKYFSKVFALEGILKRTQASFTPFLSGFLQIEETKM